jgi:hypothetical protein
MSQSLKWRTLLSVVGAAIMSLALLASNASATETAEGYERFAGCPSPEENENITSCQLVRINSGYFNMGNKEVPIENEMQLSGGTNPFGEEFSFNSNGGLTPVAQKVPGGVIGLTGLTWLLEFFGSEALTLYATTELAGTPGSPLIEPVFLPIKVHLTNPAGLLGNNCYIGSDSEPIELNLHNGAVPEFEEGSPKGVLKFNGVVLFDKTFSAPGANGCKLYLFGFIPISINGLVNEFSGLPAESGNETVQNATLELVASNFVYP